MSFRLAQAPPRKRPRRVASKIASRRNYLHYRGYEIERALDFLQGIVQDDALSVVFRTCLFPALVFRPSPKVVPLRLDLLTPRRRS